jgi:hypothetical protein
MWTAATNLLFFTGNLIPAFVSKSYHLKFEMQNDRVRLRQDNREMHLTKNPNYCFHFSPNFLRSVFRAEKGLTLVLCHAYVHAFTCWVSTWVIMHSAFSTPFCTFWIWTHGPLLLDRPKCLSMYRAHRLVFALAAWCRPTEQKIVGSNLARVQGFKGILNGEAVLRNLIRTVIVGICFK